MPDSAHFSVIIVGSGPSGLTAAARLREHGIDRVLVIEREAEAGGIPRHCFHQGYGLRDLRRVMDGPTYARRLAAAALQRGATIWTSSMVTDWAGAKSLSVVRPSGITQVSADAIVLATGARERPRTARRIPGDRPSGIVTTGQLQNLVHLHHRKVGRRAVVVGGELVSWSALMTLREAGAREFTMVTAYERPESYRTFNLGGRLALRPRVITKSRIAAIHGKGATKVVEVCDSVGTRTLVECETVVFTGDWIPDNELVRAAGIGIARDTLGPATSGTLMTDRDGVFAAGNLLHPVDTADCAALDGVHAASQVAAYLRGDSVTRGGLPVTADDSARWIFPGLWTAAARAPRDRLLMWPELFSRRPLVVARQGGVEIGHVRTRWSASPGRVFRVPSTLLDTANPDGGEITVGIC